MSLQQATSPEAGRIYALALTVGIWVVHRSVHDGGNNTVMQSAV